MEAKAKLFGHPIHQMLIVFPLGLLATSFFFDIGWLAIHRAGLGVAAYYMIAAGVIGGLVAAVFGLIDWLGIPSGTRAKAIGLWHGGGNVVPWIHADCALPVESRAERTHEKSALSTLAFCADKRRCCTGIADGLHWRFQAG